MIFLPSQTKLRPKLVIGLSTILSALYIYSHNPVSTFDFFFALA